ncbi:hypothetical protein [Streptomyces sp. NRRL S-118]|uniref:hypothetical protein n=1 Tax=Streptomyces sp. NRRL S-118 TaxID=1463881 RepID=UPI0004C53B07|nr:hypothetical protein [Streptomyces sp. NRRL S-118]
MRRERTIGVVCAVVLAVTAFTTACQRAAADRAGAAGLPEPAASTGYGEVFLGAGDCSTRGREFREVSCGSERAAARVLTRYAGPAAGRPDCPRATDFVLHVSEHRPAADEDGDGAVPRGYACMRNLEPPHPGDPGGGGGPYTLVGDCLSGTRAGQVRETACKGPGEHRPRYRVTAAVERRAQCPASTALYVALDGDGPVGCARRL